MSQLIKRISLDGLLEGFDAECYAYAKPATVLDKRTFREQIQAAKASASEEVAEAAETYQQDFVSAHFVSGKVKVLRESGAFELCELTPEFLEVAEISDRIFMEIMGINLDPKDLSPAVAHDNTSSPSANTTETPSSTGSTANSPTK